MRRDFDEQVDVIARQRAVDDRHAHFSADLLDNLADSGPDLAVEHLEPVLGRPDDMVAMMKCRVATGGIADSVSVAEASIRLKSEGFLPKRDSKSAQSGSGMVLLGSIELAPHPPNHLKNNGYFLASVPVVIAGSNSWIKRDLVQAALPATQAKAYSSVRSERRRILPMPRRQSSLHAIARHAAWLRPSSSGAFSW